MFALCKGIGVPRHVDGRDGKKFYFTIYYLCGL